MKDLNSGIWGRRQTLERVQLERAMGPMHGNDTPHDEPAFSNRLCAVIVEYWRRRGHTIRAWVESEIAPAGRVYSIRTSGVPVRLA